VPDAATRRFTMAPARAPRGRSRRGQRRPAARRGRAAVPSNGGRARTRGHAHRSIVPVVGDHRASAGRSKGARRAMNAPSSVLREAPSRPYGPFGPFGRAA
jgi:hypothetical protein